MKSKKTFHIDEFGNYEATWEESKLAINRNKVTFISNFNPHYTNENFREAQTIWGAKEEGLSYSYSDRLWEWDWNKCEQSWKVAKDKFPTLCAAQIELLSPLKLYISWQALIGLQVIPIKYLAIRRIHENRIP